MYIDMWYDDIYNPKTDKIDCFFSDLDCIYRGNIYRNGKMIGDYSTKDSIEIKKEFAVKFCD